MTQRCNTTGILGASHDSSSGSIPLAGARRRRAGITIAVVPGGSIGPPDHSEERIFIMRCIHVLGCLSAIALTACAGADAGEMSSAAEVEVPGSTSLANVTSDPLGVALEE